MDQLERIREIAERVAVAEGMEVVDVEFAGRGPNAVLRIFLDKPGGITLRDCEIVSPQVGAILSNVKAEIKPGGIVLMHDVQDKTALMLPVLLAELRARGYRVVPGGETPLETRARSA